MVMSDRSLTRLSSALKKRFGTTKPYRFGWDDPALNVLDCVLSLNRRYDAFVMPRLEAFCERHPEVVGLRGLRRMIRRYGSPGDFSRAELNYDHDARAEILLAVTEYMLRQLKRYRGPTEVVRARAWAKSVRPIDSRTLAIHGFGLAGFQYLRMLFGAQTAKPDRHIIRFVIRAVGHQVSAIEALQLLEEASRDVGVAIGGVDYAIWQAAARGK
jgi:hypothetical protein